MPTPEHAVFDFDLIKAVFCFLYLHYLGNGNASPFEAHPVAMGVAFANLLLHCISYELEQRVTRVGRGGMGLFRSILFVSLASLLFPKPCLVRSVLIVHPIFELGDDVLREAFSDCKMLLGEMEVRRGGEPDKFVVCCCVA
ncbi:hypothetical protein RHSIM_Rhsim07G0113400 [Rhododendron simsii]|uniref:Uncharacterized protein n=1 Tax=Rhododendron simsii TaxID=118357 RepID=A0A834GPH1_RHOSS|nr:hypothetical protein RHSIM_Rhsim07G0113400 [Rhododendron simsii]